MKVELVCEYCGKTYHKYQYHIKQGKQFCSVECKRLYNKNKRIKKNCEFCGKEFMVSPYYKDIKKYCSKECENKHHDSEKVLVKCSYCGKEFHKKIYRNANQYFCDVNCKIKYNSVDILLLKEMFENRGYTLLSEGKFKTTDKLDFICNNHKSLGVQTITYNAFINSKFGCKECNKISRHRLESFYYGFVKNEFDKRGYILVSNHYDNSQQKLEYICPKHKDKGIQTITFGSFRNGQGCVFCGYERTAEKSKLSYEDVYKRFKEKGMTLVSNEYLGNLHPLSYICDKHPDCGIQYTTIGRLKIRNGCRICTLERLRDSQIFSHEKFIADMAIINNNIIINSKYLGMLKPIKCICKICNCEWEVTANSIYYNHSGCPKCKISHGESEISKLLDNIPIEYDIHKRFADLTGDGGRPLSYDFYIPNYNLLIEYQGIQHMKYTPWFQRSESDFEKQILYDNLKREYAKNNNIKLLEIWYWDYKNISDILATNLQLQIPIG